MVRPDGHEVYHGDADPHDILSWSVEAIDSRVVALYPRDLPGRVLHSEESWFLDFFAPWCPPCRQMLPAFRAASTVATDVRFGSVDCDAWPDLCSRFNIQSYPTPIFYNGSSPAPHAFEGDIFNADDFVFFIEMIMAPATVELDPASFEQEVRQDTTSIWVG